MFIGDNLTMQQEDARTEQENPTQGKTANMPTKIKYKRGDLKKSVQIHCKPVKLHC